FGNLKAHYYQELADAFEKDQVVGLTDEKTIGQLAGILYELDGQGRMHIESKQKARARGLLSPDRAEALMLALCKPHQPYEYHPVRELLERRSAEGPSEDDEDDYPRLRRTRFDDFTPGNIGRYFRSLRGTW